MDKERLLLMDLELPAKVGLIERTSTSTSTRTMTITNLPPAFLR